MTRTPIADEVLSRVYGSHPPEATDQLATLDSIDVLSIVEMTLKVIGSDSPLNFPDAIDPTMSLESFISQVAGLGGADNR